MFESFVNSERCKTTHRRLTNLSSLRALLIQKDVKLNASPYLHTLRLRALLIQKDVKLRIMCLNFLRSLRALLIQKDVKQ